MVCEINSKARQNEIISQIREQEFNPETDASQNPGDERDRIGVGEAFSVLSVQDSGGVTELPVLEGAGKEELRRGVGHYETSSYPGEEGNVAIAGHRIGWGSPFRNLNRLNTCDKLTVSFEGLDYVYRVLPGGSGEGGSTNTTDSLNCFSDRIAEVGDLGRAGILGVSVVDPHENFHISRFPSQLFGGVASNGFKLITLTTCSPWWDNSSRLIIHGILTDISPI